MGLKTKDQDPDERSDEKPDDQQTRTPDEKPEGSDPGNKQDPEKPEGETEEVLFDIPGVGDDLTAEELQFSVGRLVQSLQVSEREKEDLMRKVDALEQKMSSAGKDEEVPAEWLLHPEEKKAFRKEIAQDTATIVLNILNRQRAMEQQRKGFESEDKEMTDFVKDLAKECGLKKLPPAVLNPDGIEDVFQNVAIGKRANIMKAMIRNAAIEKGLVRPTAEQVAAAEARTKEKLKGNLPDGGGDELAQPPEFEDMLNKMQAAFED